MASATQNKLADEALGLDSRIIETRGVQARIKEAIATVRDTYFDAPLGGTLQTVALLMMFGGLLPSSPALLHEDWPMINVLTAMLISCAGAYLLFRTMTDNTIRQQAYLRSLVLIKSSEPRCKPFSVPGMLFGVTVDTAKPIYVDDETLTRHCFIIGQTGVGKTVAASILMFQQIQRGGGLLFIDPKVDRQNIQNIHQFAAWCGRERDLYIINPDDPSISNTYNPILDGDSDEVADRILGLIPSTETSAGADYYKQAANQALIAIISTCKALKRGYTFLDLSILLDNEKAMQELLDEATGQLPEDDATVALSLWLEQYRKPFDPKSPESAGNLDMKRMKELLGGITGRMRNFGTGNFGEVLNTYTPEVRLFDVVSQGKICYVALPTMGKTVAANNFGKMTINDLKTSVSWLQGRHSHLRPAVPFMAFIDEAGRVLGDGMAMSVLMEQARSARVFMCLAMQNLSNLKAVSSELVEMVSGNTATKIIFRLGSQESAEELAELIGMKKTITRSLTQASARGASAEFTKLGPGYTASDNKATTLAEREDEDYLVPPDAIKRLDKGECILLVEGSDLYDLRVPMLEFDPNMASVVGNFSILHPRKRFTTGLNLNRRWKSFVSSGGSRSFGQRPGKRNKATDDADDE